MTALVTSFLPYIATGIALLLGVFGYGYSQRRAGAAKEKARQAAKDKLAVEERLEMHREDSDIDRQVRDLPDADASKEAMKWAKRR